MQPTLLSGALKEVEKEAGIFSSLCYCKISKISVQKGLAIILKIYYIRNRESQRSGYPQIM